MSWIMLDYHCAACGVTSESLESRAGPDAVKPCDCGGQRRRCLSPVAQKTKYAEVTTGKSDERPPWALDTRHLAGEWGE